MLMGKAKMQNYHKCTHIDKCTLPNQHLQRNIFIFGPIELNQLNSTKLQEGNTFNWSNKGWHRIIFISVKREFLKNVSFCIWAFIHMKVVSIFITP